MPPFRRPARDRNGDPLTDGRRLLQRFRSRRPRRGHRRLRRGVPREPARPQGRARRRGQARRHVPPPRLHPDQGPARERGVQRAPPPRQGLRPRPRRRRRRSTTRRWPPAATWSSPGCGRASSRWSRSTTSPGSRAGAGSRAARRCGSSMAGDDGTPGAGGERVLSATDVILATGLAGQEPARPRARREADRHLGRRPAHRTRCRRIVIVIGAGAVGVEFASMYHDLGVAGDAARVPAGDRAARGPRREQGARAELQPARASRSSPTPASTRRRSRRATTACGSPSGPRARRRPSSRRRCCSSPPAGPPTSRTWASRRRPPRSTAGIVKVDDHMRTREPHLYAIGDIVGGLMLAHTAAHEGITAAHTIAGDPDVHGMDYVKQPRATYCRPEIASVGLTEQECEERGLPIKIAQGAVPGHRQGAHRRRVRGLREDHREQGDRRDARRPHHRPARHGPHRGGEPRVHARGRRRGRSALTTHAHPTLSEILGETAMAIDGRSINF